LDAFTTDLMTSMLCSDLIALNDLQIDDLGPTGPSWCNCSTSIADSPGATQHRGLMQSAEQPFIEQEQLKDDSGASILTSANRTGCWSQRRCIRSTNQTKNVKYRRDKMAASRGNVRRLRRALTMLWAIDDRAYSQIILQLSPATRSRQYERLQPQRPAWNSLQNDTIAERMDRALSVFSVSRFLRTLVLTSTWPTSVLALKYTEWCIVITVTWNRSWPSRFWLIVAELGVRRPANKILASYFEH